VNPPWQGMFERAMEARQRRHEDTLASLEEPLGREAVRVAFLCACLLADFLLPPELLALGAPGALAAVALLAGLVTAEGYAYWKVWGPRGAWRMP
jgi:hypothetical protein